MKNRTETTLVSRLAQHPTLKARFEEILEVADNTHGDLIRADEAEQRAIEPVRQLGNELLHDRAKQRVIVSANELKETENEVMGNGKKNNVAHPIWWDCGARTLLRSS